MAGRAAAAAKKDQEPDPDDGRQQVALFFGTQNGTAEGFAKVRARSSSPTLLLLVCLSCARCLISSPFYAPAARRSRRRPRRATTRPSSRCSIWYEPRRRRCFFLNLLLPLPSAHTIDLSGFRMTTPPITRSMRRSSRRRTSHSSSSQCKDHLQLLLTSLQHQWIAC